MKALPKETLAQLFTEARTHHGWSSQKVSDDTIKEIYNLFKWGPTSMNTSPTRIVFVRSESEKEKLYPALMGLNVDQVQAAPVTAIVAFDEKFYDHLPTLFPAFDAKSMFDGNKSLSDVTALRNGSLQGAYLMIAARSLGLDVGPMSGFDNAKVDEMFFKETSWKSNFLCNIGFGDPSKLYPRGPRLDFGVACKIV